MAGGDGSASVDVGFAGWAALSESTIRRRCSIAEALGVVAIQLGLKKICTPKPRTQRSNEPARSPLRWEQRLFLIPEGESKVSMAKDSRVPNAATFSILKEDHTLANMLRMQLLKNPKVLFAGYKVPHPLEHMFILKVQTTPDTTPMDVFNTELNNLMNEISSIKLKFENQLTLHGIEGGRRL
ncbi:DNA-directed RNA polymerase, partial [Zopfochytrium polystomum]